MDFDPTPYPILDAVLTWLAIGGTFIALVALVTVLIAMLTGVRGLKRKFVTGLTDFLVLSPKRVWAMSMLTFREAIRNKVLLIFVVFVMLFMFAGWFLSGGEFDQSGAKVHTSFVLTTMTWIVLPVSLLLSCWGIPEDIRKRSLHTVVTKPMRRSEVVVGRMVGFGLIGTMIVVVMSVVGYIWMQRQSPFLVGMVDEYVQDGDVVKHIEFANPKVSGRDGLEIKLGEETIKVRDEQELKNNHSSIYSLFETAMEQARQRVMACRVPVHGELSFLDPQGEPTPRGVNTGDIWEFRSYIRGGSKATAIWDFEGITPERFGDSLPLESRFESFRTHKGVVDQKLLALYILVNEEKGLRVPLSAFEVNEYHDGDNVYTVDRKIEYIDEATTQERTVDLYDDIVSDGKLRVEVRCLDTGQFLGMARPDLFVRAPDRTFASGFFKACFCIWLSMLIVVMIGVSASCFLKGPVATLLTLVFLILGQGLAMNFIEKITGDDWKGGGLFESSIKMATHATLTVGLEDSATNRAIKKIDDVGSAGLWLVRWLLPDFRHFSSASTWVENGFDVQFSSTIAACIATTLGYFLPCFAIGYFSLLIRELEAK